MIGTTEMLPVYPSSSSTLCTTPPGSRYPHNPLYSMDSDSCPSRVEPQSTGGVWVNVVSVASGALWYQYCTPWGRSWTPSSSYPAGVVGAKAPRSTVLTVMYFGGVAVTACTDAWVASCRTTMLMPSLYFAPSLPDSLILSSPIRFVKKPLNRSRDSVHSRRDR